MCTHNRFVDHEGKDVGIKNDGRCGDVSPVSLSLEFLRNSATEIRLWPSGNSVGERVGLL